MIIQRILLLWLLVNFSIVFEKGYCFGQIQNSNFFIVNRTEVNDAHLNTPSFTKTTKIPNWQYTATNTPYYPAWSDSSGNLRFYYNGTRILNQNDLPLIQGLNIETNYFSNNNINPPMYPECFFYSPYKNEDTLFFIYPKSWPNRFFPYIKYYYAKIDPNSNNGRGRLLEVDIPLIDQGLTRLNTFGFHKNGRDLIMINHSFNQDKLERVFTSFKISFPIKEAEKIDSVGIYDMQYINLNPLFNQYDLSPNGNYVMLIQHETFFNNFPRLFLFELENGTGVFNKRLYVDTINDPTYQTFNSLISHFVFSPNSNSIIGSPTNSTKNYQFSLNNKSNDSVLSYWKHIFNFGILGVTSNTSIWPNGKIHFLNPINSVEFSSFGQLKNIENIDSTAFLDTGIVKNINYGAFRNNTPFCIRGIGYRIWDTCRGDTTRLSYVGIYRDSARWIFDDPSSGNANTQNGYNVWHVFSDTGLFQCKLLLFSEGIADTFTIPVRINGYPKAITPIDTFICPYTPFAFSTLAGMDRIRWNNNDTHSFKLLYPGNYWVEQSLNGCTVRDSISIKADTLQAYVSSLSPAPCIHQNFQIIDSSYGGIRSFVSHNFRVDTLSFSDTFNIIESRDTLQLLWVAQSALGCLDSLSLQWVNQPKPQGSLSLSSDTLLCLNSPLISWQSSVQHHLPITQSHWIWDDGLPAHAINDQGHLFLSPADSSAHTHILAHFWSDSLGCSDTLFRSVQLAALPQGVILADTLVCAQSPFSISLVPLDTSVQYGAWYEDFNFRFALSGDVDTSFQSRLGLAGIYSYQWVIRNSSFCYDTLELRQEILDLAPIAIQNWDSLVCPNQSLNLIWDSSNFNQQVAYWDAQWFRDGQADGPLITRPYAWDNRIPDAPDSSFFRHLLLTSTHINTCRDSVLLTQRVLPRPQAQLLVLDSSFCAQNGFYRLQEQSPSDLPLSITWTSSTGAAGVLNPQDQLYLPAPLSGGSQGLQVIYTNIHQCRDTFNQLLFFENPPLALWTLSDSILCQNQNLNLSYQAENLSYDSLSWSNGDTALSLILGSGNNSLDIPLKQAGNFSLVRRMQSLNQCAYQYSKNIQVNPAPIAAFQDSLACLNQDTRVINYSSISSGSIQSSYWNLAGLYDTLIGGIADFSYSIPRPGLWDLSLILRSDLNCLDTFNQQIRVYPLAQPQILVEDQIFNPPYIQLQLRAQNRNSRPIELWQWSSSLHQLQGEQVVLDFPVEQAGYYRIRLSATDTLGCSASTDSLWSIFPPTLLYIPNAFSPDQNQNNDLWRPLGLDYAMSYQLIIYNRWGQILLDTQDPKQAWDGRFQNQALPQGIYYFHLRAVSRENELIQKAGEILLVR